VQPTIHDPRYQLLRRELIHLRKASGLTQVDIAAKLNMGQSFISKIERGEAYVDALLMIDWCLACSVNPTTVVARLEGLENPALAQVPRSVEEQRAP
jgi:transcriptional regulator with XRE-family HTH domain